MSFYLHQNERREEELRQYAQADAWEWYCELKRNSNEPIDRERR